MAVTVPALPPEGSNDWYDHYTAIDQVVRPLKDATPTGISLLSAADAASVRGAIGAGTSNIAIGTTSSTAKAGNYAPAAADISDATATGRSVITAASSAAARTATGAAASASVEGMMTHDGSAGGGTRPTGYYRVRWVGGTVRPTNMIAGDVWEHDA